LTVHQTGSTKSLGTLDFYQLPSTSLVNSPFNPITLHIVAVCVNRIGTVPSYERVVKSICGGETGLPGDVLLARCNVGTDFFEPLPPHLDALMPRPRPWPDSARAFGAPRLGASYLQPTVASVDAAFAAWKNALPRRLRVDGASDFAAIVMEDLRTYVAMDGVRNVTSTAAPRLAARKRVMDRMAVGMNSAQAALEERISMAS
jgi:hypothetical protein